MGFEWDENKRQSNITKHGIDFADAVKIFDGFAVNRQDTRADYGELRFVATGLLEGREISVIHTPRGDNTRIISARRARLEERKIYYEEVQKHGNRLRETGQND